MMVMRSCGYAYEALTGHTLRLTHLEVFAVMILRQHRLVTRINLLVGGERRWKDRYPEAIYLLARDVHSEPHALNS